MPGIIGIVTTMAFASSNDAVDSAHSELQLVLEAARRANCDAKYGPAFLKAGRFVPLETAPDHGYQNLTQGDRPTTRE